MSRDAIRAELSRAAIAAAELLDLERQKLTRLDDPAARRVQALAIQAAAVERDRCNTALFAFETQRTR